MNYSDFTALSKTFAGTVMSSGMMYGYGLIYLYMGFQVMYDRLMTMYYKKQDFNYLLFIVKTFLLYMLPVCYTMVLIMFVLPFIGEGPIYAHIIEEFYSKSCQDYWWTNVILISNFYPSTVKEMCGSHFSLIANEF